VWRKQHAVIEFLIAENIPLINIHQQMVVVYGQVYVNISAVQCSAASVGDVQLAQVSLNLTAQH
jgi:hypothetical protein